MDIIELCMLLFAYYFSAYLLQPDDFLNIKRITEPDLLGTNLNRCFSYSLFLTMITPIILGISGRIEYVDFLIESTVIMGVFILIASLLMEGAGGSAKSILIYSNKTALARRESAAFDLISFLIFVFLYSAFFIQ